ncbi:MAG: PAS domain S-box protein [Bacteroidota bacterium]|nr:PAS domain S-box protein [Bacteroidota bacterium]
MKNPLESYISQVVFKINSSYKISVVWPEQHKLFGYPATELLSTAITDHISKDHLSLFKKTITTLHKTAKAKPVTIELSMLLKNGRHKWFSFFIHRVKEKNKIQFIITATDIDSYKSKEAKQKSSKSKDLNTIEAISQKELIANNLIQTSDTIALCIDLTGRVKFMNKGAERITGYSFKELKDKNWFSIVVPRKKYPDVFRAFQERTYSKDYINPIITKKGIEKTIHWNNSFLKEKNGEEILLSVGVDISKLEANTRLLKDKEYQFELFASSIPIPAYFSTRGGKTLFVNKAFEDTFGYTKEEVPTIEHWYKAAYPKAELKNAVKRWSIHAKKAAEGKEKLHQRETYVRCKNGTHKHIGLSVCYGGEFIFATFIDFTQQKEIEQNLVNSRDSFRKILENLPLPVASCDFKFDLLYTNKKFRDFFGYDFKEIAVYPSWFKKIKFDTPEDEAAHDREFYASMELSRKDPYAPMPLLEREIYTKSGELKDVEIRFGIFQEEIYAIIHDVTEKKKAEKQLLRQHEVFKNIAENIPFPFATADLNLNINFTNKKFKSFFKLPFNTKEIIPFEDWYAYVLIDSFEERNLNIKNFRELIEQYKVNPNINFPVLTRKVRFGDTEIKIINLNFTIYDNTIYCIIEDITEKIKAQNKILESERKFKALAKNIALPVLCYSFTTTECTFINKPFTALLGYTLDEIHNFSAWNKHFIYSDHATRTALEHEWQNAVNDRINKRTKHVAIFERSIRCKNGDVRLFEITFTVSDELVYAVLNDITEKRKAVALLRESEQRFKALAENMPIAIGSHTLDGRVGFLNKHFIATIGYDIHEIPTLKKWYQLTQPDVQKRKELYKNWNELVKDFIAGKSEQKPYVEAPIHCKDGSIRIFNFLFSYHNNIIYIMLVDITERRMAEQELIASHIQLRELATYLQKVREEERKYIAREIHDEFGQLVTGLKMDVSLLKAKIEKRLPDLAPRLSETIELADQVVKSVRRISSELRPSVLDDIGLAAAIEWQSKEFEKRTGIPCSFKHNLKDDHLSVDVKSNLFRIYQESLTNIMRHAEATEVKVSLIEKDDYIHLIIKDNGKGFTEAGKSKSFGLLGMKERAIMINGIFAIESELQKGTTIQISVPLKS